MSFNHPLLRVPTSIAWVRLACVQREILLIDHANCEKKAASTALALMFSYAENLLLCDRLSRLAREELRHFEQVAKLIQTLGIVPQRLAPGRYAASLRKLVANHEPQRELDLMVCGAFIEARSCERFEILAECIGGATGEFFEGLHQAEARHYKLYLDLARHAANRAQLSLQDRVAVFAAHEAELITGEDEIFRFHSGLPI